MDDTKFYITRYRVCYDIIIGTKLFVFCIKTAIEKRSPTSTLCSNAHNSSKLLNMHGVNFPIGICVGGAGKTRMCDSSQ